MAKAATPEPNLPWVEYDEDRGFRRTVYVILLLFMGAGVTMNLIKLPEITQQNLVDVSPRLAKLILEKQKVKPPTPKQEKPKEKKKAEKKKEKRKRSRKRKPRKKNLKSRTRAKSPNKAA